MSQLIDQIAIWIESLVAAIGYPGIYIISLIENIFPPLPTEPLLPFVGMLVVEGRMTFVIAWFTAVAGSISGALLVYCLGIWVDDRVIRAGIRRCGKYLKITEAELDQAIVLFNRYGAPAVFFGRSIPVIKSVVSLAAGVSRMPVHKFLFFSSMNSLLSVGVWLYMGTVVGQNWDILLVLVDRFLPVFIVAGSALLVIVAIVVLLRRRQITPETSVLLRGVRLIRDKQPHPDA